MILPSTTVTEDGWRETIDQLAAGSRTLLGLWGDPPNVHMALLLDETTNDIAVISYACQDGTFPSVGAKHPPAIRLERTIRDLCGLDAAGAVDRRPCRSRATLRFPPSEGRKPASDRGRPGACRHHRARAFRFTAMANTSCGWSSGSAMCTGASSN